MRSIIFATIGLVVMVVAAHGEVPVGTTADEAAIRAVLDARNAAYNRHDAVTMTSVYALDVDLVTGTGRYLSGRAALERYYADQFDGPGLSSRSNGYWSGQRCGLSVCST
jgi:hypothetical protein